jgi:hypothetical protein
MSKTETNPLATHLDKMRLAASLDGKARRLRYKADRTWPKQARELRNQADSLEAQAEALFRNR